MESNKDMIEKNVKHIITHSQVKQIEENTAELQEVIENIIQRINEIKDNPNKIYDIMETVRKTEATSTHST